MGVPVPLGEPPEQAAEADGHGLLQLGRCTLLFLLRLMGVVDDGVSVERSAVVHLEDSHELVRIEQVDHADGQADDEAQGAGDNDQPEAPAELEGKHDVLDVDSERTVRQHPEVDASGEEHGEAGEGHGVPAVSGHHHHQHVHDQPEGEGGPEEDGSVVAGLAVRPAPTESLRIDGHVLDDGEDGEGQALDQRLAVLLLQLHGPLPGEALVEVDVHRVVVVDGHGVESDVGMAQADVDAHAAHDLLGGERLVRAGDFRLAHVPAGAAVADCSKKAIN